MIGSPAKHRVLVADDEPDVHAITTLSLRGLAYGGRGVEFVSASSGVETVQALRSHPETAVVLLDVVMETTSAGLDACRAIREELGNRLVRILLRTGQPGAAPERQAIDEYDIDGYLPKAELTTTRLYAAVRTALKAHDELTELHRQRQVLALLHDSAVALTAFSPLERMLERIVGTAMAVVPSALGVLALRTVDARGDHREHLIHLATDRDLAAAEAAAVAVAARVSEDPGVLADQTGGRFGTDLLVPIILHRDLGDGWIYLQGPFSGDVALPPLSLLAAHAANALYAAVAQSILAEREGSIYDSFKV